jgi:hypothetical protein
MLLSPGFYTGATPLRRSDDRQGSIEDILSIRDQNQTFKPVFFLALAPPAFAFLGAA